MPCWLYCIITTQSSIHLIIWCKDVCWLHMAVDSPIGTHEFAGCIVTKGFVALSFEFRFLRVPNNLLKASAVRRDTRHIICHILFVF